MTTEENVLFASRARLVKSSWFSVLREGVLSLKPDHLIFSRDGVELNAPISALSDVQSHSSPQQQGLSFKVAGVRYTCSFDRLSSPSVTGSLVSSGDLYPEIRDVVHKVGTRTEIFSSHGLCTAWAYVLDRAIQGQLQV